MSRGHDQHELVTIQRTYGDAPVLSDRHTDECEINLAGKKVVHVRLRVTSHHLQLDRGVAAAKLGDDVGREANIPKREIGNAQTADDPGGVIPQRKQRAILNLNQASGVLDELLPCRRHADLASIPPQKLNPKLTLQHLNALRDCRLGDPEARGCTAIMTVVSDRYKRPQVAQFHRRMLIINSNDCITFCSVRMPPMRGYSPKAVPKLSARVLIVDDEPANTLLLEQFLADTATDIRSLTDSRQVEQVFIEFAPDIVLLDLHMPGIDGQEVLRRLRSARESLGFLPVVVLTSDTSRAARNSALILGADDFLTKPLDRTEVVLRVRNLLRMRELFVDLAAADRALESGRETR